MIHKVVSLEPELQISAFPDPEMFCQNGVPRCLPISAHARKVFRECTYMACQLLCRRRHKSSRRIEPAVHASLIARQWNIVQVAIEDDVAEAQRRSALVSENSVNLPSADHIIDRPGQTRGKHPP